MEYKGYYFYAEIDDEVDYDIFEPLMILLDEDFKKAGLGIKVIITHRRNDTIKYDYKFKLVGRLLGIQLFLPWLHKRLKQLVQTVNCMFLIVYKEYKYLYCPKDDQMINIQN
jgi:hypothetical protein